MHRKIGLVSASTLAVLLSLPLAANAQYQTPQFQGAQFQTIQSGNNCQFGERIDGTSAADAKRALESAGFTSVRGLKKGCDNVWHGVASHSGAEIGVALTPDGRIYPESN